MQYERIIPGEFIARPNRFVALVKINGEEIVCHVKNTGRCQELLTPGAIVYCQRSDNNLRKTAYDLIAVEKGKRLINMDSAAPNRVFREWVECQGFLGQKAVLWPEYRYGQSRLDFRLDLPQGPCLVEVKGVTLEEQGHTFFPDAPTQRGVRHLQELMRAVQEGYRAVAFFVIQMQQVQDFTPNDRTHPAFGEALRQEAQEGVEVLAWDCSVTPGSLTLRQPVPVVL